MNNNTPTLNIKDLALLKSNPKKYYKKQLEKEDTIEAETVKHPVTEHARYVGSTGNIESYDDPEHGDCERIRYSDGTQVIMSEGQILRVITKEGNNVDFYDNDGWPETIDEDGRNYGLEAGQGSDFFEENGGDMFDELDGQSLENFNSLSSAMKLSISDGLTEALNNLYNDPKIDINNITDSDIDKWIESNQDNLEFLDAMDWIQEYQDENWDTNKYDAIREFGSLVKNNSFEDCDSFLTQYTLSDLPEGQGVNKAIVQNNGLLQETSQSTYETDNGEHSFSEGNWNIITVRENGNPANKGVQIPETGPLQFAPFISAPGQKYERRIIDEKNRIIIQTPYEPGMDRHIWG